RVASLAAGAWPVSGVVCALSSPPAAVMVLMELALEELGPGEFALGGVLTARSTVPPINARIMQAKTIRSLRRKRGVGHNKPNSGCTSCAAGMAPPPSIAHPSARGLNP